MSGIYAVPIVRLWMGYRWGLDANIGIVVVVQTARQDLPWCEV
jgi:hypothetical protein